MDKKEESEDKISSIHNKFNIFSSKQQVGEVYVQSVSPINSKTASNNTLVDSQCIIIESSRVKSKTDANIQVYEDCFNRARIDKLSPPLGQLCRVCPMGSVAWTKCQFVHPNNNNKESGNNKSMLQMSVVNGLDVSCAANKNSQKLPMIVEIIANEIDRHRIATFFRVEFDKPNHSEYLDDICEFGFTHIIIIGEFQYGPMFLDCYGCVFRIDVMSEVLWFIGDSLEEAAAKPWSQKATWVVEEDGSIDSSEYCKYANPDSFLQ